MKLLILENRLKPVKYQRKKYKEGDAKKRKQNNSYLESLQSYKDITHKILLSRILSPSCKLPAIIL